MLFRCCILWYIVVKMVKTIVLCSKILFCRSTASNYMTIVRISPNISLHFHTYFCEYNNCSSVSGQPNVPL